MKRLVAVVAFGLVMAACGDSGNSFGTEPPADSSTTSVSTSAPTTAVSGGAVTTVEGARAAVVRIVAKGTFVDPIEGIQANVPGSGSGFIISPDGLAVTNNHVVTGGALFQVYVGDETRPRDARVVGVSECSDLAVIDIDGDGFAFLDWYDGAINAGLDIFAAGYPLGDPEYTLLDGIVSKADADGETTWASVEAVIEHSADTLPGNSGGPIFTQNAAVVAVNYAGNSVGQSFAIGREVAQPIVAQLAAGNDVDSIGVNGEAIFAGGFSGIWVYSVASGSPADAAGIEAGDLMISLEGLDLAADGTMADYCDVLRSHTATDVLAVGVYRSTTDEVLSGQINGDQLELTFSFAGDIEASGDTSGPAPYTDYMEVTDDTGAITVQVPVSWNDTVGVNWEIDGELIGPALTTAPSYDAWVNTWGTPGVFIAASNRYPGTRLEMLDTATFSDCDYSERLPYDDGLYTGEFDIWENCGPEGSTFVVIAAEPPGGGFVILVEILMVDDRDIAASDEIIASFLIGGDLGALVAGGTTSGGYALGSGLSCLDIANEGFWYGDAAAYWVREGRPSLMDPDGNGIPCEDEYDFQQVDDFFFPWFQEPSGLFCVDLATNGWSYSDALAYWIAEGMPDRMDADVDGIPCETIYDGDEIDAWLYFDQYIG